MSTIFKLVNSLSEEERLGYYAFAKAKNKRPDVKNIQLFQYITSGIYKDLDMKLYGASNKNALHALTKRLQDSIIDYLAIHHFKGEQQQEMELLKRLLASRILLERKLYKLGWKQLEKAEKQARELELYALLNEIYHTQLQYIHVLEKPLEPLIKLVGRNQKWYAQEMKLAIVYARIKQQIGQSKNVLELIEQELAVHDIQLDQQLSYKSIYQLMNITAQAAHLELNYYAIYPFIQRAHHILTEKKHLAIRHTYYHLETLFIIANVYLRNKQFNQAQQVLDEIKHYKFSNTDHQRYALILSLVYNFTGNNDKAITVVASIKKGTPQLALAQATYLFHNLQFKEASITLRDIHHTDAWIEKNIGFNYLIKLKITQLLIHIERDQLDLVHSRLRSFVKKYRKELIARGEDRVLTYISFLQAYDNDPKIMTTTKFKDRVERSFTWIGVEREDLFVMSFYAWLKAKMEQRDTYAVTLDLVQSAINSSTDL